MRDEIDGRLWVQHGAAFGEQLLQVARNLGSTWDRLQAMKFDAPWRRDESANCAR